MSLVRRGRQMPPGTGAKISTALKGKYTGPNASAWRGGVSDLPYCCGWKTIRNRLVQAEGACCKDCGSIEILVVHHRNWDKQDCRRENLAVLCRACHCSRHNRRLIE